jgi:hypothetical protein
MRKVYEGYKLIETKDIEAHRLIPRNGFDVRDYVLAKRRIKAEGITEPFEVIKRGNRYLLKSNPITFIAARCLRYKTVPCLIRNPRYELILHRTLRNLDID